SGCYHPFSRGRARFLAGARTGTEWSRYRIGTPIRQRISRAKHALGADPRCGCRFADRDMRKRDSIMPLDTLVSTFVTLLLVVDPLGLVPTFLAVPEGLPIKARRQVAARASLIAAVVLAGAAIGGDWLFRTVGISLPAFRIAGGLLLFSIATEMVFGVRIER